MRYRGYFLYPTALLLSVLLVPVGFIVGLIISGFKGYLDQYLLRLAIAHDMLGNAYCGELFNLFVKEGGYKFGNPKETISSVIGKDKIAGKMTNAETKVDEVLDCLDKNHSIESIDNNV